LRPGRAIMVSVQGFLGVSVLCYTLECESKVKVVVSSSELPAG
jgi:hypothetical protein